MFPWSMYQVTQTAATFVGILEQKKALQQVLAVQPLGPYDPTDLVVLEVSGRQRCYLESLAGPYRLITEEIFGILEQCAIIVFR